MRDLTDYFRRIRGICSEADCDMPITGFVVGGRKLCAHHLYAHAMRDPQAVLFLYPLPAEAEALVRKAWGDE